MSLSETDRNTLRDKADYNIMFVAQEKDVVPNIPPAEDFIKVIEAMIKNS